VLKKMTKIRSFSGEFQRKLLLAEASQEEISFDDRLTSSVGDTVRANIKEILLCLLNSDFPYKDLNSAVQAIEELVEVEKPVWKPKVWYEIAPGKFIIGDYYKEIWGRSSDYEE
jgi:hypothetical protein